MARPHHIMWCLMPVLLVAAIDLVMTVSHPAFDEESCPHQKWLENLASGKIITFVALAFGILVLISLEAADESPAKLTRRMEETVQDSMVRQLSANRAGLLPIQDDVLHTSPRARYRDDRTSVLNNDGGSVTQTLQFPNVTTVVNNIRCDHPAQEQDTPCQLKVGTGKELSCTDISDSISTALTAEDLIYKKWPGPCPGAVTVPSGGEMITRHCSLGIDGFNLVTYEDGRVFLSYHTEEAAACLEFPDGVDSFPERGSVLFSFSKAGEEIATWTPFDSGRWDANGKVVRVPPAWVP